VPIVFVNVTDPVGAGYVESMARPGGNALALFYSSMASVGNGWSYSSR
jgi:putative ABC transport system substrate-binding protein